MTHYDELGVDKNANDEDLKKAYRKRANEVHPDKGGDPDEFHKVRSAYLVLSNPRKREEYDRTGKADAYESNNVMDIIGSMFNEILESDDVDETVDIIEVVKNAMKASIMNGMIERKKLEPKLHRLQKLIKRFKKKKRKSEGNLFSQITQNKVDEIKSDIFEIEKQINEFKKALVIVDDYEFDVAYIDKWGSSTNHSKNPQTIRQFFIDNSSK